MNRKEQPVFSGLARYFPDALKYVSWVSLQGNLQHHPDEPLHWDRDKSTDEMDALLRHAIDSGDNWDCVDTDGVLHLGKTCWRSLAALQKVLERDGKVHEAIPAELEEYTQELKSKMRAKLTLLHKPFNDFVASQPKEVKDKLKKELKHRALKRKKLQ